MQEKDETTPKDAESQPINNMVDSNAPLTIAMDVGICAWSQVLVAFLIAINSFGYLFSFGLFQSHWTESLHLPSSKIAWIGSIQMFLLFFIGTLSGRAMDAGLFRWLLWGGCLMQIMGTFVTASSRSYVQLILFQGIVQGLGNGLLFTPAVALVATYFDKRRAVALGIAASGAPLGGIIFPLIGRQLSGQIGYSWAIRVMGFVQLFNAIVILAVARPRVGARKKGSIIEWAAFKEAPYSMFTVGMFLCLWGLYFAYYYITVYGRQILHLSPGDSLNLLITMNAVGILGRIIPAFIADKFFGSFNTLIPFMAGVGIMMFEWILVTNSKQFYNFVVVYGICASAVQILLTTTVSRMTTDISKIGVRTGMVFSIISIACLTGPPIAGALIQAGNGSFLYAQIFGGTTVSVGTGVLVLARVIDSRLSKRIDSTGA